LVRMHELALATSVVEYIQRVAGEHDLAKICEFHLEVGDMTHIDPWQLKYCLSMVSKGTIAEGAKIRIKRRKVVLKCRSCGRVSGLKLVESIADFELKCPRCKSLDVGIDKGRELTLTRIKGSK
jgi:hydrogenase nickel incorporation protein HypA/HybF